MGEEQVSSELEVHAACVFLDSFQQLVGEG